MSFDNFPRLTEEEVMKLQFENKKVALWSICDDIGMLLFFLSTLTKNDEETYTEVTQLIMVLGSLIEKLQKIKNHLETAHNQAVSIAQASRN